MSPRDRRLSGLSASPLAALVMAMMAVGGGAACSSGGGGAARSETTVAVVAGDPVTFDQAAVLARALNENYLAGGARVSIDAPVTEGVTVRGEGEIDWANHFGRLTMTRRMEGREPTESDTREIFWAPEATLEGGLPGFPEAMADAGKPGVEWVQRQPDPDENLTDRLLAFVMRLASTRADNPAVVQQDGALYLGSDTVNGEEVSIFRLGRGTYWIRDGDGVLVRYQAEVSGLPGPVDVTLRDHGPVTLDTPMIDAVAQQAEVDAEYRAAAGNWPFPDDG